MDHKWNWDDGFDLKTIFDQLEFDAEPTERYIDTFPVTELECKIDATELPNDASFIENLTKRPIKVVSKVARLETHNLYRNETDMSRYKTGVLIDGYFEITSWNSFKKSKQTWIKIKDDLTYITTDKFSIPVLIRSERKVPPSSRIYASTMREVKSWSYKGEFKKKCVDVSVLLGSCYFTLTFANAYFCDRHLSQLEIEYDGHMRGTRALTLSKILEHFDMLYSTIFNEARPKPTVLTKAQWIGAMHVLQKDNP